MTAKRRVVVIGAGAAGAAAALAAAGAGSQVTLLRPSPGASALSSGALDIAGSRWETPVAVVNGNTIALEAPGKGQWVALVEGP